MTVQEVIGRAKTEGRSLLTEIEAKEVLKQAGISVVETRLATSRDEAVSISQKLGFPVVLKIASSDVVHKSDAGGVKLGLETAEQVGKAYGDIMAAIKKAYPQAKIQGVSVQKMARPGVEVIVGMSKDAQFGPVLMFGLGGIYVELFEDVTFALAPISRAAADRMIRRVKAHRLLEGLRASEPADLEGIRECLIRVGELVADFERIVELDINPLIAGPAELGNAVADVRIRIED